MRDFAWTLRDGGLALAFLDPELRLLDAGFTAGLFSRSPYGIRESICVR